MQQAINRLVIADMDDGILVLDHSGRMFEMNPAAERMLGGNLKKGMIGVKLADVIALRPMVDTLAISRSAMRVRRPENWKMRFHLFLFPATWMKVKGVFPAQRYRAQVLNTAVLVSDQNDRILSRI
jgi:transcriptional regulator with PAS, ATPase and Fis domain